MQKDKEVKTVGLGFVDALTLLFIALKLTGQIDWNWNLGFESDSGSPFRFWRCSPS
jgi:hypothetical protein